MKKLSLCKAAAAVTAGLMLASTFAMPTLALADNETTDVSIQRLTDDTTDDTLSFKVPSVIPLVAKADGTLIGPSPDKVKVTNESYFPVQITSFGIWADNDTNVMQFVASSNPTGNDEIYFELSAGSGKDAVVLNSYKARWNINLPDPPTITPDPVTTRFTEGSYGIDTSGMAELSFTAKGGSHVSTEFSVTGKAGPLTFDTKDPVKLATAEWTIEPM